jgi:hypothetical protein
VSDVHLIKAGDKVGASEAALLGKLGVKPFKYGLEVVKVYDSGSLFEPAVLEITGAWLVLYGLVVLMTRFHFPKLKTAAASSSPWCSRLPVRGIHEIRRAGRLSIRQHAETTSPLECLTAHMICCLLRVP